MSIESKMALTVDFLREFIAAYRNHPALWKMGSKEYVDKRLKKEGYDNLIGICWKFNIVADREFVVRKINSLRGAFRKEHNKVLAAAAIGQKYIPVLWYYKLLLFTTDKEIPDAFDSLWKDEHNETLEDYSGENSEVYSENNIGLIASNDCSNESRERKPNLSEPEEIITEESLPEEHLQINMNFPEEKGSRKRLYCRPLPYPSKRPYGPYSIERYTDEFTSIGETVAAKLRRMEENQRFYAELLLTKVLGLGLFDKLNENSDIIINEATPVSHLNASNVPTTSLSDQELITSDPQSEM